MDKIVYEDEKDIKAITGEIVGKEGEFLKIRKKEDKRVVWIPIKRIIKVEQLNKEVSK